MSFDHDVFISYAREDDLCPPGGGRGWVRMFKEELEFRLRRRFGKRHFPRIWRDEEELNLNQAFRPEIRQRLEKSMLFVALYSTNYTSSDSCREEWEYFHRYWSNHPEGLYLGERHFRIFNVLLRNLAVDTWPPVFRECIAFPLCDSDTPNRLGDPTDPQQDPKRFDCQMDRLIDALESLILSSVSISSRSPPDSKGKSVVFLAHAADTLKTVRNRLIADLERNAIEVAAKPPPPFGAEHSGALKGVLQRTSLAVHLLDRYPGLELEDDPQRAYPQVQLEEAFAASVPQLVWLPDRAELQASESETHGRFLNGLETRRSPGGHFRFLCGRREHLTQMVLDQLQEVQKPPPEEKFDVLIDAENRDRRFGALLMAYLEGERVPCLLHQERERADDRVDEFDENLRLVRALVILFGQADPMLVHRRLERSARRRLDARAKGAEVRLRHFSIFLPPGSRANVAELEQAWGWLNIRILDNRHSETIDPSAVRPLLEVTNPA